MSSVLLMCLHENKPEEEGPGPLGVPRLALCRHMCLSGRDAAGTSVPQASMHFFTTEFGVFLLQHELASLDASLRHLGSHTALPWPPGLFPLSSSCMLGDPRPSAGLCAPPPPLSAFHQAVRIFFAMFPQPPGPCCEDRALRLTVPQTLATLASAGLLAPPERLPFQCSSCV